MVRYCVGTSGFSYVHWRGTFYPEDLPQRKWLEYYVQHFQTVELNSTFYRLPAEETVQAWRARVPQEFLFSLKASRLITHVYRLQDVKEVLKTFFSRVYLLEEKLGPILYQLPPGMEQDLDLLTAFLQQLPDSVRHVVEFRNKSWYNETVIDVLRKYSVAFCIHDLKGIESPVVVTAPFAYFRFHGSSGKYRGGYSEEELRRWVACIRQLESLKVGEVFVYFNNDVEGHAVHNARQMMQLFGVSAAI